MSGADGPDRATPCDENVPQLTFLSIVRARASNAPPRARCNAVFGLDSMSRAISVSPTPRLLIFLPRRQTRFRLFHVFVGLKVVRRGRAVGSTADGPPTGLRTEASQASPITGGGSTPQARKQAEGRTEPQARRRGGVTAPGHLMEGALVDSKLIAVSARSQLSRKLVESSADPSLR
jgi:hypothetical protein